MPYNKQNFVDGDTLTAENLNHIEDGVYQNEERTNNLEKAVGGTYELVEEITTTEDLTSLKRTAHPDGTPYNFKGAKVRMDVPAGTGTGVVNTNYRNASTLLSQSSTNTIATAKRYQWSRAWREHGMWECEFTTGASNTYAATTYKMIRSVDIINDLNITQIDIAATTSGVPLPAGTIIRIYGVRA